MALFKMAKSAITGLFAKPATLMYPINPAKKFKTTRGHIENEISRCIFCGLCQKKCPPEAISVDRAARTWGIDRFRCINCNSCVEVCPVKCLRMENDYTKPTTDAEMKVVLKGESAAKQ